MSIIRSILIWFGIAIVTIFYFIFIFFPASFILFFIDPTQKLIHRLIRFWAKLILFFCPAMRVHLKGERKLSSRKAYVFVSNHQSHADILVLLHLKHAFKFVAKKELFAIPFLGWGMTIARYIPIIRGNHKSGRETLKQAARFLEKGISVLFFPEGTRSLDGNIREFKQGAFRLAIEQGVPVVPVVISGTCDLLKKGRKVFADDVCEVTAVVGSPHEPPEGKENSLVSFTDRIRREMIEALDTIRS